MVFHWCLYNKMLYCPSARQDLRRGREIMHGAVQQILAYSVNQTYNLLAIEGGGGEGGSPSIPYPANF